MSRYNATIYIADGVYTGSCSLPNYSTSTGIITLKSVSGVAGNVVIGPISCAQACSWNIYNITIKQNNKTTAGWSNTIRAINNATINLYNVIIDMTNFEITNGNIAVLGCSNGGAIQIPGNYSENICGLTIKVTDTFVFQMLIRLENNGKVLFNADLAIEGNHSFDDTVYLTSLSILQFIRTSAPYPDHNPTIITNGEYTGRRYRVFNNSIIYTGGKGEEFFPGNTAGSTDTGGQYS